MATASEKAVLDVAEKALDHIEDQIETIEKAVPGRHFNLNGTTTSQQAAILTGAFVLGAVVGGVGGYFLTKKYVSDKLRLQFEKIAEQEIAETKAHYEKLHAVRDKPLSPEEMLSQLHGEEVSGDDAAESAAALKLIKNYQGVTEEREESDENVEETSKVSYHRNVFTDPEVARATAELDDEGWNYDREMQVRSEHPDEPYIISHDEFFENENDYEQASLIYYEGDDTLSDDKSVAVPDAEATVGEDNLTRFGHGSKDKNTLYVRNERLELDFEIIRSNGKYTVEVLGFDDEDSLQHSSSRPGIRKFRGHDD